MTHSLYALTVDFRAQAEKLGELDLDEQTLRDTLESISGELEDKAMNVAMYCRNLESTAASIKDAEAQMAARRKAIESRAAHLRKYLLDSMQYAGIHKIECAHFTLSLKSNPPSVDVYEPGLVPSEFMKQAEPPPATVDKTAVKAAIKAGRDVAGCRLAHSDRLDISA